MSRILSLLFKFVLYRCFKLLECVLRGNNRFMFVAVIFVDVPLCDSISVRKACMFSCDWNPCNDLSV